MQITAYPYNTKYPGSYYIHRRNSQLILSTEQTFIKDLLNVSSSSRDFEYFLEKYIKIPGESNHNYSSPKKWKEINVISKYMTKLAN